GAAVGGGGRRFVAGWRWRGRGPPLELITKAAPWEQGRADLPAGAAHPAGGPLLYPPGARGVPAGPGWLAAWESLVWVICPGRQAPPLTDPAARPAPLEPAQPTLFESALAALTGRPSAGSSWPSRRPPPTPRPPGRGTR